LSLRVGELFASLTLDTSGFTSAMDSVREQARRTGKKISGIGKTMTLSATTPILGLGTAAVVTATKFDDSMRKVQAITQASGDDFDLLNDKAKKLGTSTSFSASEAADGMSFLGMAGWETTEILEGMDGVLNLAASGQMDLAKAADVTSNIMSGMGISASEAGRVADVLAQASSSANVDVGMLGESMKYAGPIAKEFGLSLEETATIAAKMGDAGIQGSEAGTAMRSAFARLADPTAESAKWLDKLGISASDSEGNMKDMGIILGDLEGAFAGLSEQERLQAASSIFGQEGMAGWMNVIGVGAGEFDNFTESLENSEGRAKEMADIMNGGLGGAIKSLKSLAEGVLITFGDDLESVVSSAVGFLKKLLGVFEGMSPEMRRIIIVVLGIVAAIGPLLIVVGMLMTTFAAVSAPVLGIVVGIIALIGVLIWAYVKFETFRTVVDTVFKFAWSIIKGFFSSVILMFTGFINIFMGIWNTLKALFTLDWKGAWEGIVQIAKGIGQAFLGWLGSFAFGGIGRIFGKLGGKAIGWGKNMIGGFIRGIKAKIGAVKDAVKGVIGRIGGFLGFGSPTKEGEGRHIVDWGSNMVGGFLDGIKSAQGSVSKSVAEMAGQLNPNVSMPSVQASVNGNQTVNHTFGTIDLNISGEGASNLNEDSIASAVEQRIVESISQSDRRLPTRTSIR